MTVLSLRSGGVTSGTAEVVAVVDAGSSVRLAVADNPGLSGPAFYGPDAPDAGGAVKLTATGLDPLTRYYYALEVDSALDTSMTGEFATFQVAGERWRSFTVAAASCAGLNTDEPGGYPGPSTTLAPDRCSDHPVFADIAARARDFGVFLHMGDAMYYNLGSGSFGITYQGVPTQRRMWSDWESIPRQADLFRRLPLNHILDDHDFGVGNSDRTTPGREDVAQVYRERTAHYPLPATGGAGGSGIYHSFDMGRVLVLVSDLRYYRDPPTQADPRTMLGADQLAWTENVLATSQAKALIWVSTQRWVAGVNPPNANWGSYQVDRLRLQQMFGDYGWLDRMCVVHGDNHAMGIDTGATNPYGGFPMFCYSPLDSNAKIGSLSPYNLGARAQRGQYGTFRVDDLGSVVRVTGKAVYA